VKTFRDPFVRVSVRGPKTMKLPARGAVVASSTNVPMIERARFVIDTCSDERTRFLSRRKVDLVPAGPVARFEAGSCSDPRCKREAAGAQSKAVVDAPENTSEGVKLRGCSY
jgi:hypothetical protein